MDILPTLRQGLAAAREKGYQPQKSAKADLHPFWVVISTAPIVILIFIWACSFLLGKAHKANSAKRRAFAKAVGWSDTTTIVGFWHPYCNAGGGGERVLWTAIHWTLRHQPNVACIVYSGDYPEASKDDILNRVKVSEYVVLAMISQLTLNHRTDLTLL